MTTDSLTLLKRLEHRKRLELEQHDNDIVPLGSGIHRLITSDEQEKPLSIRCEQKSTLKMFSPSSTEKLEEDQRSLNTLTRTTKSYNTSADRERQSGEEVIDCELVFEEISGLNL